MDIEKSSRHSKIIGQFGEALICNWLSRSGFEVITVDHTGIDIIGFKSSTNQRLGITVKSRTRDIGREKESVNIFSYQKGKDDRQKLFDSCKAFACEPWIAIYVETAYFADVYLLSLENYDKTYRGKKNRAIDDWKMIEKNQQQYINDPNCKHIRITFYQTNWWTN